MTQELIDSLPTGEYKGISFKFASPEDGRKIVGFYKGLFQGDGNACKILAEKFDYLGTNDSINFVQAKNYRDHWRQELIIKEEPK